MMSFLSDPFVICALLEGYVLIPLVFFPTRDWTYRLMKSPWIVAPWVLWYVVGVGLHPETLLAFYSDPTLAAVAELVGHPAATNWVWAHALAGDVFVFRWVYLDMRRRHDAALLIPVMVVAVSFNMPIGLLIYLVYRSVYRPESTEPPPKKTV